VWIVLWEPRTHGFYASQFMVVACLYAGTWVPRCAFLLWALGIVFALVSIYIEHWTSCCIVWHDMAFSYIALHFVGCILVRDVFRALPLLCSEAYAEYGLFLVLSLSCLHLVGCILVWELYPQSYLYSFVILVEPCGSSCFYHHSRCGS